MRNPYRLLSQHIIFDSRFMTVFEDHVALPDSNSARFAWLRIAPGTLTLAVDSGLNAYMVREWKYGIARPSLELIGGAIEPGEEPLHSAQRELKEEGGISAHRWTPLGVLDPFPTFIDSPTHHFLAEEVYETPHPADENEVLELVKLPLAEAVERVLAGEITHAPSCALILKSAEVLRRR